jgi:hypothetical protein
MNVHLVRGHVYWSVLRRGRGSHIVIARGVLTDPYPAEQNVVGSLLMEAAYAAHRLLSD